MPTLPDTLTCDTTLLARFRADESYNYARELQAPDMSVWDWLMEKVAQWLADIFAIRHSGDFRSFLYMVAAVVIIGGIAWLLYHYRTDRKSTRLNSSHANISYAVFCLKK